MCATHQHLLQVLTQIKEKLRLSCAFTTLPIGLEDKLSGLVDIVHMRAIYFEGKTPIPPSFAPLLTLLYQAKQAATCATLKSRPTWQTPPRLRAALWSRQSEKSTKKWYRFPLFQFVNLSCDEPAGRHFLIGE